MRDQQTVKRVARPVDICRGSEKNFRRRAVQIPAGIVGQGEYAFYRLLQAATLDKELYFKQGDRGKEQANTSIQQWGGSPIIRQHPDDGISVQEYHFSVSRAWK